ncbi:MAG: hypothetical protein V6Z86_06760 [Hyphomicrobiales bacterium]
MAATFEQVTPAKSAKVVDVLRAGLTAGTIAAPPKRAVMIVRRGECEGKNADDDHRD